MTSFGRDERRGAFFSFRPSATGPSMVRRRPMSPLPLRSPITVATHDVEDRLLQYDHVTPADAMIPDSPEAIPESLRIPRLFPTADGGSHEEEDEGEDDTRQEARPATSRQEAAATEERTSSRASPPLLPRPFFPMAPAPPSPSLLLLLPTPPATCEEEGSAYDDDRTTTSTCDESASVSTYRSPSPFGRRRRCNEVGRHGVMTGRWADRGIGASMAGELSSALASCWRGMTFKGCCRYPLSPLGGGGIEDHDDDDEERGDNEAAFVRRMVRHKRKFDAFVPISEEEWSSGGGGSSDDTAAAETSLPAPSAAAERLPVAPSPPSPPRESPRPRRATGEHQMPPIRLQFRPSEHGLCGDIGPLGLMFEGDYGLQAPSEEEEPYPEDLALPSLVGS